MRTLARLWRDARGTALIEGAFTIPMLLLLSGGVFDASLGFSKKLKVQQGADRGVQYAMSVGLTNATETAIKAEVTAGSGVPASSITVTFWLECSGVLQSNFSGTCSSGVPARYVSVRAAGSYTPTFAQVFNSNAITLSGFAEGRIQ